MRRIFVLLTLLIATQTHAQGLDPNAFYRLVSVNNAGQSLDIRNNNGKHEFARLQPTGPQSGQQLQFAANGPWVKITTAFRGKSMCLDVANGGEVDGAVLLLPCGNFSGQNWQFKSSSGGLKLVTQFRGADMCLDVITGGQAKGFLRLEPCSSRNRGQLWSIEGNG